MNPVGEFLVSHWRILGVSLIVRFLLSSRTKNFSNVSGRFIMSDDTSAINVNRMSSNNNTSSTKNIWYRQYY